jgi:prepilin-type N-terminal cleavage/methylation domain-containing protein
MKPESDRVCGQGGKGFTLIEVVLSIVVLAVGLVFVQRTLLGSFTALNTIEHWSQAEQILDEKIWDVKRRVREQGRTVQRESQNEMFLGNEKVYRGNMDIHWMDPQGRLIKVNAQIAWGRTGMSHIIKRTIYLWVPHATWKG